MEIRNVFFWEMGHYRVHGSILWNRFEICSSTLCIFDINILVSAMMICLVLVVRKIWNQKCENFVEKECRGECEW